MGISRNRCVFLDRDGVINLKLPEGRYVTRWEEFEFLPGVADDCQGRKPKPGMILQAGREHQINLSASWMIGDSVMDVEAGKAAGCRTIWLKSRVPYPTASSQPDFVAVSIARATARILEGDKPFRSGNWK